MYKFCFFIIFLPLFVACGGGGSTDESNDPISPLVEEERFQLGGIVKGLSGSVTIVNGDDELVLTEDGNFTFATKLTKGTIYSVRIIEQPENQLCEVVNGTSFIVLDTNNIIVECVSIVPVNVTIDVPDGFNLLDLRLNSNYEGLGDDSEPGLVVGGPQVLTVSNNSFISLLDNTAGNSENPANIIYLSFIDDVTRGDFVIDSSTTAISLVLLEPTIAAAIQDRELSVSSILDSLILKLNPAGELDNLSSQIKSLADSGKTLNVSDLSNDLSGLQMVIDLAADYLVTLPLTVPEPLAGASRSELAGVSFDFDQNESGLEITAYNHRSRAVIVDSAGFTATELKPYDIVSFSIVDEVIDAQTMLNLSIVGPGINGLVSDTNNSNFYEASATTNLYRYISPSIKSVLGLTNAYALDLTSCLDEFLVDEPGKGTTLTNQLLGAMSPDQEAQDELVNGEYYRGFTAMFNRGMASLLATIDTSKQHEDIPIISCDQYTVGTITDTRKTAAINNISALLTLINDVYNSDLDLSGTFDRTNISYLVDTLVSSSPEVNWSLGRQWSVTGNDLDGDFAVQSVSISESAPPELSISSDQVSEIRLTLDPLNQDDQSNTYVLDNSGTNSCLGEILVESDSGVNFYCTNTNLPVENQRTGQVVVSSLGDTVLKYTFSFTAARFDCVTIIDCPTIEVMGEVIVEK